MKDKKIKLFRREKVTLDAFGEAEIRVREIDFEGRVSVSPDGLARVIWETGNDANRVILIVGNLLIWQREFINPTFAAVSNRGALTVNAEAFYVVLSQGEILMREQFSTPLVNCGFANEEKIAWVTTSNQFALFSTFNKRRIFDVDLVNEGLV